MSSLHRAGLIAAGLFASTAVVAACADSGDDPPGISPDAGAEGAPPNVPEGGTTDAGTAPETSVFSGDACTSAGWCSLEVAPQLTFVDLWPLEGGSAVAIAARDDRSSVVVYEDATWKTIHEAPFVLTSVWASATEVWVAGGEPGHVVQGVRSGTSWTWTVHSIPAPAPVTAIWKSGPAADDDVYAIADTRVWRFAGSGADAGEWTIAFGGDAPEPEMALYALTGTGKADVWVTGARGIYPDCGFVLHKTDAGFVTVVEGTPDPSNPFPPVCLTLNGSIPANGPVKLATATASNELVAYVEGFENHYVARIRQLGDGGIDLQTSTIGNFQFSYPKDRRSLWGASADDLYLAGFSRVTRGRNLWADGGGWEISTVALEGYALVKLFNVVRGTRSDDVWLAGESYVFHKTTH